MTDWPLLISELAARGITQADIAKLTGRHINTVSAYARGLINDPPYSVGVVIVATHQLYCQSGHEMLESLASPSDNTQDPV